MTLELVSFPIKNCDLNHSYVTNYQKTPASLKTIKKKKHPRENVGVFARFFPNQYETHLRVTIVSCIFNYHPYLGLSCLAQDQKRYFYIPHKSDSHDPIHQIII